MMEMKNEPDRENKSDFHEERAGACPGTGTAEDCEVLIMPFIDSKVTVKVKDAHMARRRSARLRETALPEEREEHRRI